MEFGELMRKNFRGVPELNRLNIASTHGSRGLKPCSLSLPIAHEKRKTPEGLGKFLGRRS